MDVDETGVAGDVLESIVVLGVALLEHHEQGPLDAVSTVEQRDSSLHVEPLKNELDEELLFRDEVLVDVRALLEEHAAYLTPVLLETGTADLMGVDVILAEALHAEVVYEAVLCHLVHVLFDPLVIDVSRDKP